MSSKSNIYMNWSTGKDSAMALFSIIEQNQYNIKTLLTSINKNFNRVSMHGIRVELLKKQAIKLNIPLQLVELSEQATMEEYNSKMNEAVEKLKKEDIHIACFGDIFLEDLRKYRENQLQQKKIKCIFPLWKKNTKQLALEFIQKGFKAIVTCVSDKYFDQSFVGSEYDQSFLDNLPKEVDPCGENGEFHTFCYSGQIFSEPIKFQKGEIVYKTYNHPNTTDCSTIQHDLGFWFCDLI